MDGDVTNHEITDNDKKLGYVFHPGVSPSALFDSDVEAFETFLRRSSNVSSQSNNCCKKPSLGAISRLLL